MSKYGSSESYKSIKIAEALANFSLKVRKYEQLKRVFDGDCEVVKEFLERDLTSLKLLNVPDDLGNTPLHYFAMSGRNDLFKLLVYKNAICDIKNNDGYTALQWVAMLGTPEMLDALMRNENENENEIDIECVDHLGNTLLLLAYSAKNFEMIKFLYAMGVNNNAVNDEGANVLHLSVSGNDLKLVALALEQMSDQQDINSKDKKNNTPLNLAAKNGNLDVVMLLLNQGADPAIPDIRKIPPMESAIKNDSMEIVLALYSKNPDAVYGAEKNSALHLAALYGSNKMVVGLIENGANFLAVNGNGQTPIEAAFNPFLSDRSEQIITLYEKSPNAVYGEKKNSALHLAAICSVSKQCNLSKVTKGLIKNGADILALNTDGKTPFELHFTGGFVNSEEIIAFYKAYPTVKYGKDENTVLHVVAEGSVNVDQRLLTVGGLHELNFIDVIDKLLAAGADKTALNKKGQLPYELANSEAVKKFLYVAPVENKAPENPDLISVSFDRNKPSKERVSFFSGKLNNSSSSLNKTDPVTHKNEPGKHYI